MKLKCEAVLWQAIAFATLVFVGIGVWFVHKGWNMERGARGKSGRHSAFTSWLTANHADNKTLPLIFPPPRKLQRLPDWTLKLPIKVEAAKGLEAPSNLLKRELAEIFGDDAIAEKGLTVVSLELDTRNLRREEEYAIETGVNKVTLRAHDLQGAFWAVHSFAVAVVYHAVSLGLEPVGYLNLLGHLERAYQKPPYTEHGGIMIQNDEVYEHFVFPILNEMLEIYGPVRWFHCGMD